jgi:phospholipid/cholesterol/gamma-HCH transport system substrate-binding protein
MFNTPEFKVGALVVIVSGIIGIMSLKVSESPGLFSGQKRYYFEVEDAGGLVKKSAARVAGINVGIIEDIELIDGKARVTLMLDGDVVVTESAAVEIRANGILGDKYVEVLPGSTQDKALKAGGQILTTSQRGSLDALMNEVSKITDSLSSLAETVNKAVQNDGDPDSPVGRIILNLEKLTTDLSDMSGANKEKINDIVGQVDRITKTLDKFMNDESPDGFQAGWNKAVDSMHRLDDIMKNVEEITDKVNSGKGTIGRLVNDEETVEGINTAIENVNDFLGGAGTMETSIDYHAEVFTDDDITKSYLNFKIQPGLDRYYEVGIVDDPRGLVSEQDRETSGDVSENITVRKTRKDKLKFNAIFAKNFWDFTIRGGIMESSGGVGLDYHLFRRRLRLSVESIGFDDGNIRAFARYNVLKGIYLIGGGDELADEDLRSGFVGAGIFITNDDLKTLASRVSF